MGFFDFLLIRKMIQDMRPSVGQATGIEQHHTIAAHAEVLQVCIHGKQATIPSRLAQFKESLEP
jgi:hypothetical protein